MRTSLLLAGASLALLAHGDNQNHEAPLINDNPMGAAYIATLPARTDTSIRGNITALTSPDRSSIIFAMAIEGLPTAAGTGPFPYHIHDQPVSADGNCTSTLGHLDPYGRGETPPCDPSSPWTCQVGDLAGKHGMLLTNASGLPAGVFSTNYAEFFVDANPGRGSFFGNRSITIHFHNTTRVTCANFTEISGGGVIGAEPVPSSLTALSGVPTVTESAVAPKTMNGHGYDGTEGAGATTSFASGVVATATRATDSAGSSTGSAGVTQFTGGAVKGRMSHFSAALGALFGALVFVG